jgi:hypothetical protein
VSAHAAAAAALPPSLLERSKLTIQHWPEGFADRRNIYSVDA